MYWECIHVGLVCRAQVWRGKIPWWFWSNSLLHIHTFLLSDAALWMPLGFQSIAELLLKFLDHPHTLPVVLANGLLLDLLLWKLVLLIQS